MLLTKEGKVIEYRLLPEKTIKKEKYARKGLAGNQPEGFRSCLRGTGCSVLINELSSTSRYDLDGEDDDGSSTHSLACRSCLPTRGHPVPSHQ